MLMDEYEKWNAGNTHHRGGSIYLPFLKQIEAILPDDMEATAETGCGRTTILFSNKSASHTVFTFDDKDQENSSVNSALDCPLTKTENLRWIFGPTQKTVPSYNHSTYDAVLLDGPHAWPCPELEYFFFYPHIRNDGFLIVDDVHIPTIARMADVIAEDEMWETAGVFGTTAVFKRTDAPTFFRYGDGWEVQYFNRRRIPQFTDYYLIDDVQMDPFTKARGK
jgi:hypothetical protein